MNYRSTIPAGIGMLCFIIGTYAVPGSLFQRVLFLVGALILLGTALHTRQLLLVVLEIVVTLSTLLAFTPTGPVVRLLIFGVAAIAGVVYLLSVNYRSVDPYWPIGAAGLIVLAAGLPISSTFPVLFDGLMATGAAVLAGYSFTVYYTNDVPVQLAWGIFNVIFTIRPVIRLLNAFDLLLIV